MRCVERTFEYLDGLALVALLRANALDAHLFDENFVRQDWFYIIFYGGFRVVVPSSQLDQAIDIRDRFRNGAFDLPAEDCDIPQCPNCGERSGEPDPNPRRTLFLIYIFFFVFSGFLLASEYAIGFYVVLWMGVHTVMLIPPLFRYLIIGRYRCRTCQATWRETPDKPFCVQQREAERALMDSIP